MKSTEENDFNNFISYAISKGLLDVEQLMENVNSAKKDEVIKHHKYSIWQGKNGYWYTYLPDPVRNAKGKLVKRSSLEKLEGALVDFYDETDHSPTFGACFRMQNKYYLENHKISGNTYDRKCNDYDRYIKGTKFDKEKIESMTEGDIVVFLDSILRENDGNITRKAFYNVKSLICMVFAYAKIIKGYKCIYVNDVLKNYVPNPRQLRQPADSLQVFNEEEVGLIIDLITTKYRNSIRHMGLLFMLFTGLRVGEIAVLKVSDISMNYKFHIQRILTKQKDEDGITRRIIQEFAKTEESQKEVLMSYDAIDVYKHILKIRREAGETSEWLISENGKYLLHTKYDKCIRKLCDELSIPERSCHKLRKTYCSQLLDAGVNEKVVQSQMRHTDIRTTQTHYHFCIKTEQAKRAEINKVRLLKDGI